MAHPDFYIVGAPKSGIGTISSWLGQRHDILLQNENPGNFHASDITRRLINPDQYTQPFAGAGSLLTGEISEWYLFSRTALSNISKTTPRARFVVCLHNPAEIAWAMHSDFLTNNIEDVHNFDAAWHLSYARKKGQKAKLCQDPRILDYRSICAQGRQVAKLLSHIPRKHIHFVFLEDLQKHPAAAWQSLEQFLHLDHLPRDSWHIEDFTIKRPLFSLYEATKLFDRVKQSAFPNSPKKLHLGAYRNGLSRWPGIIKPVPQETRQTISDYLSEDIAALSVLANKDLTHWVS